MVLAAVRLREEAFHRMEKLIRSVAFAATFAMSTLAPGMFFAHEAAAKEATRVNAEDTDRRGNPFAGALFAMTNETAHNRIVVYGRAEDGTLTRLRSVRTRGLGQGVDTDTQGPLRLSENHRYLYAVYRGSDNISVSKGMGLALDFAN